VLVSTFSLEQDAIVGPSTLADTIPLAFDPRDGGESATLRAVRRAFDDTRIFEYEALGLAPIHTAALPDSVRQWAERRDRFLMDPAGRGSTAPPLPAAYGVSAYERYQDCPFKFFAADVLKLGELLEDEPSVSPRVRGRFVHEAFQRFFDEWDRRAGGTITSARVDDARAVFVEVVQPLLDRLPAADAALERARLFGSAIAVGMVDVVLGIEAGRSADVVERWIERRLDGEYSLGLPDGRRIALKGVADRIDLLAGQRLRVIDYKSGSAPAAKRALQVPIYALCAQESLEAERGGRWTVDEASYVAFAGKRSLVQLVRPGRADGDETLADARDRLLDVVDGIGRGEFPVRPHEPHLCSYCPYPSVCRKDYVGDE
jgi:RecB family exonuclease